MADEPSDACSRTGEGGAKGGRNNKRKSTQACSYPNKKYGSETREEREDYVVSVFTCVALVLVYLVIEEDTEDEDEYDEDKEARADLFKAVVDCFIAMKAWAELELGPGNSYIKKIFGMLRFVPGYNEAVKAKQEATSKRKP